MTVIYVPHSLDGECDVIYVPHSLDVECDVTYVPHSPYTCATFVKYEPFSLDLTSGEVDVREQLLHINVQRFRGGLVFKAHRLCTSLKSRIERKRRMTSGEVVIVGGVR